MLDRILRAIRLDPTVYRKVAKDQNAMTEAAIIVAIVSLMSSIGSAISSGSFFSTLILTLSAAILIGWIGWAVLTYFVGTWLFKADTDIPEMMRVLGYANAPRFLGILGFIPCVGFLIVIASWILSLIAGIIAVREAMDLETGNAIITVAISWVIAFGLSLVISLLFGGGMAAFSALIG